MFFLPFKLLNHKGSHYFYVNIEEEDIVSFKGYHSESDKPVFKYRITPIWSQQKGTVSTV